MSKEEIRDLLDSTTHLSKVEQACAIWNAAIEECVKEATTTTKLYDYGDWETGTIVDTKSILSLKIEDDEK